MLDFLIIPKPILRSKTLTPKQKIVLSLIVAHSGKKNYTVASNKLLAIEAQTTNKTITTMLAKFEKELGLIERGSDPIYRRRITIGKAFSNQLKKAKEE